MKPTVMDMLVSYLLKGGVLLETKGEFETQIVIPFTDDNGKPIEGEIGIKINCRDLTIRTIKP